MVRALPFRLAQGSVRSWRSPREYDALQGDYLRLFEVGRRGAAPCPLYAGHYARDRLAVMEECIRFYNFFGLRTAPGQMPDHLPVQLEFLAFLAAREREPDADRASYRRAQRDFLDRRMLPWLRKLEPAVRAEQPVAFYRALVSLAHRFMAADREYLGEALAES